MAGGRRQRPFNRRPACEQRRPRPAAERLHHLRVLPVLVPRASRLPPPPAGVRRRAIAHPPPVRGLRVRLALPAGQASAVERADAVAPARGRRAPRPRPRSRAVTGDARQRDIHLGAVPERAVDSVPLEGQELERSVHRQGQRPRGLHRSHRAAAAQARRLRARVVAHAPVARRVDAERRDVLDSVCQ